MGTNKFTISHQRKRCIGCGSCVIYSPNCWRINAQDGKAELIGGITKGEITVAEYGLELLEENKKVANACPMQIIKVSK